MLLGQLGYTNILHHQHPAINDREQITRLLIITLFYFKIVSFELSNLYTFYVSCGTEKDNLIDNRELKMAIISFIFVAYIFYSRVIL